MKKHQPIAHFDKITTCQALDHDGRRCNNKPYSYLDYHGDNEIYSIMDDKQPTWVKAIVCKKHWEACK